MPIEIKAVCDNPTCQMLPVQTAVSDRWPESFIVIQIKQGIVGKTHAPQILGFCTRRCLVQWADRS